MKARSKLEKTLIFDEGLQRPVELASLTAQRLTELAGTKGLQAAARAVLLEGADFLQKGVEALKQQQQKQAALERLEADRERLEQTIEKLKGTSGNGAEPLVRRLVELETKRNQLEIAVKAGTENATRRLGALSTLLERLNPAPPKSKESQ
jgi:nucleotidyltransferase/DNA polymerase involved in DNA repair